MKQQPFYQTTAKFIAALMIVMLVLGALPATPARAVVNGGFTTTTVLCDPHAVMVDSSTTCTATVTGGKKSSPPMRGAYTAAPTPTGTVSWTNAGGVGTFAPSSCTLSGSGNSASCSVTYTPTSAGTGVHLITATYAGDTTYGTSYGLDYVLIVPWLDYLSPDSAAEGDDAFILHVYGTGFFPPHPAPKAGISGTYGFYFYPGSIVCWNGEPRTTTFVDETELEADIPAEDIISAHSVAFVTVFNPIGVFADINTGPTVGNFTSCGYDFIGKAAIPAADIISNSNMVSPLPMMSNALPFFITFTGAAVTGFDMDTGDDPSATFEGITANATGNGTLVVAQYAENPAGTVFGHGNQYFDVHAGTGNTFTQVTFQVCGVRARETLILFWDGSKWAPASNQTRGPGNCVTVVVDATTLPNLEQLAGALIRTQVVGGGGYLIYFFDVPPSHWAYSWVMDLAKAGITTGCGYRLFCPEEPVTRAQMAIFLERGMNGWDYTPPAATGMVFADVPLSYWSVDWIEKLFADGITGGCGTNPLNYCPDGPVSHAQMAVLLLRAKHGAAYTPPNATGIFTDVPTSFWAANWIEQLAAEGITTGCGGGNYCPEAPVTRAEMAKFLVITFNLP